MKNITKKIAGLATLTLAVSIVMPASAKPFGQNGQGHNCELPEQAEGNGYGLDNRCHKPKRPVFDRIDSDDDGLLSLDEVTYARLVHAERRFNRLDTDGDELITLEEYLAAIEKRQEKIEEYSEELIECLEEKLGELPERPERLEPEERFNQLDTNQDGVLEKLELAEGIMARVEETFANKDTDGDGFISEEEFEAAAADRIDRRKAVKECIAEIAEEEEIFDELSGADTKSVAP